MKRRCRRTPGTFDIEREEIDEFVERLVSTAEAFLTVVSLGGRAVSESSREVAEYLKGLRFWERPGCVGLLMDVDREHVRKCPPAKRERIVEEVEARFEAYHRALEEGGYL